MPPADDPRPIADRIARHLDLPGDGRLEFRAAGPQDVDGLVALFEALSPEDRYRRFFSAFHPDREFVEQLVDADEAGGVQLVAIQTDDDGERVIAEAGYRLLDDGDGELCITVDRSARGWMAPYLLDTLMDAARLHGVANLRAVVQIGNRPMLALVRARGYATFDRGERTIVETTTSTTEPTPCWPPLHHRPRVLVESKGGRWRLSPDMDDAGIDVVACGGPSARTTARCPMIEGEPCPLVQGADLVVFALSRHDPEAARLLAAHEASGTRPLVVEVRPGGPAGPAPDDAEVVDAADVDALREAVEHLLGIELRPDPDDQAERAAT